MVLGSGFKKQCHGGTTTKSKKVRKDARAGGHSLWNAYKLCTTACSVFWLTLLLCLTSLLQAGRDSYPQKGEDCSTLTPKWDSTSKLCKNYEPAQRVKPALNVLKEANCGIFSFTFSSWSQFSAMQCKHHPFCTKRAEAWSAPQQQHPGQPWGSALTAWAWWSPGRNKTIQIFSLGKRQLATELWGYRRALGSYTIYLPCTGKQASSTRDTCYELPCSLKGQFCW